MSGRTLVSSLLVALLVAAIGLPLAAQQSATPDAALPPTQTQPAVAQPIYNVSMVERSIVAVDYRNKHTTDVNFAGTALMPRADGHAKVEPHTGRLELELHFHHLQPARTFGPEYLTYVLWAITPEGRATNLGEVVPNDDGDADLKLTTPLQDFGMILTAEPYFAVSQPSEMVVQENVPRPDTAGTAHLTNAKFRALQRGRYMVNLTPAQLPATAADMKKTPLQLLEAENAVAIAQASGAGQYASDTLDKARNLLMQAQDAFRRDKNNKTAVTAAARTAAQTAEDARLLSIQKRQEEQAAAESAAAQQRLETARSRAEAEAARAEQARLQAQQEAAQRARAEQQAQTTEAARQQAEQARLQAQQEAQAAAQQRQQAEQQAQQAQQQALTAAQQQQEAQQQLQQAQAERQSAEQQRQAAAQQAEQARLQAQQAEQEKAQVQQQAEQSRRQLLQQLNQVMQTRDTAKGLIMTMSDVLFDTGKATLKPGAKLRLAKVAGIILSYPQLRIDVDGFTDSTGSPQFNQVLSDQRAAAVRDFLISQGVSPNNIVARGFGESEPVASNANAAGRQQNRRVELVVSGTAIAANPAAPAEPGAAATGGVSGAVTTTPATTPQQQPNQPAVANPQPSTAPPPPPR